MAAPADGSSSWSARPLCSEMVDLSRMAPVFFSYLAIAQELGRSDWIEELFDHVFSRERGIPREEPALHIRMPPLPCTVSQRTLRDQVRHQRLRQACDSSLSRDQRQPNRCYRYAKNRVHVRELQRAV